MEISKQIMHHLFIKLSEYSICEQELRKCTMFNKK